MQLSCLVEAIDVDYSAGEPASTYLLDALSRGSHAVSANKGPVVHQRARLMAAAAAAGVRCVRAGVTAVTYVVGWLGYLV